MVEERKEGGHHHHHHHSEKEDGSAKFKRQCLNSIQRRKVMKKWTLFTMIITAIVLFVALIAVYTLDK